jgi:hypothetical protein
MLTFFTHAVLFFTAVMAGRVCSDNSYPKLGIASFLALELGYLWFLFGSWWIAGILTLTGTVIVLWCQRGVSDTSRPEKTP